MPKVNIVFFASLRETLKTDHLELSLEQPLTVFELKQRLAEHLQQPLLLEDTANLATRHFFFDEFTLLSDQCHRVLLHRFLLH